MSTPHDLAAALLDEGSFAPITSAGSAQATVCGWGTVDGEDVIVCALCAFDGDGSDAAHVRALDLALRSGRPLVTLINGAGPAPAPEAEASEAGRGEALRAAARLCGVVPQVTVLLGAAGGALAWLVALADVVVGVEAAGSPVLSPPDALATSSGALLTPQGSLAAGQAHDPAAVHHWASDVDEALGIAREVLWYLPANNQVAPPRRAVSAPDDDAAGVGDLLPSGPHVGYDVRTVIDALTDDVLELHARHGRAVVVALAHLDGRSVGIVANQPSVDAGHLDAESAEKAARFVSLCDGFNLPVLTLVDCPGPRATLADERGGLARRTARLVGAYAGASVPLVTVVTRRGTGDIALALGSRAVGADVVLAWQGAQVSPDGVDAMIPAASTRASIADALRRLERKRAALPPSKHGGGPW